MEITHSPNCESRALQPDDTRKACNCGAIVKHDIEKHQLLYDEQQIVYCSEPACEFNQPRLDPLPKHSAIASILWQWHDEMESKAHWWQNTTDDPYKISIAVYVSLKEQTGSLAKVLVRNYGEREK